MSDEVSRPQRVLHWQRECKRDCPLCWDQAVYEARDRLSWLKDTGMTLMVGTKTRPVLSNDKGRLFVGETLEPMNTAGRGGRVWTAMDLELLKYNVNFKEDKRYDA